VASVSIHSGAKGGGQNSRDWGQQLPQESGVISLRLPASAGGQKHQGWRNWSRPRGSGGRRPGSRWRPPTVGVAVAAADGEVALVAANGGAGGGGRQRQGRWSSSASVAGPVVVVGVGGGRGCWQGWR